jgi:hypothetical protein
VRGDSLADRAISRELWPSSTSFKHCICRGLKSSPTAPPKIASISQSSISRIVTPESWVTKIIYFTTQISRKTSPEKRNLFARESPSDLQIIELYTICVDLKL